MEGVKKKAMAAQYTEVTLEDMDKFLKRSFRALRPKQGQQRGEYYYDLHLGKFVGVRVWTSVGLHSGTGAGVGADAIRVQLISLKDNGPLEKGKAPIVKRTQGWRNSLQDKIEEFIEKYDDREDFWEQWAETRQRSSGPERALKQYEQTNDLEMEQVAPAPPVQVAPTPRPEYQREIPLEKLRGDITDKQVGYIRSLLRSIDHNMWRELGLDSATGFDRIPTNAELQTLSKRQASAAIDLLLKAGYGRRYASEFEDETTSVVTYDRR
jgi:hypothetical protein